MQSIYLLRILFLVSFLPYIWLNRRQAKYNWETFFDKKIKLFPVFSLPYLLYIPYLWVGSFILVILESGTNYMLTMILANFIASAVWFLFPNGVKRPEWRKMNDSGIFSKLLFLIYKADKYDTNGFPSGHVFHSLLISYFLSLVYPSLTFLFVFSGLIISASTVFTKQHYVVDVVGGILVAMFSVWIL